MGIDEAVGAAAKAIQEKGPAAWSLAVEATRAQAVWEAAGCGVGVLIGLVGMAGGLLLARRVPHETSNYVSATAEELAAGRYHGHTEWRVVRTPWAGAKSGEPWAIVGLCVAGLSVLPFAINALGAAGWLARVFHPEAFTAADLLSRLGR